MENNKEIFKALVVDDEADIVEMLQYNLEKVGYEVQGAYNGVQALEIVKEFKPDLIMLDIMMPKMDGIETCRQLRNMPQTKDSYIVFLTARAEEYSEIAAFEGGADDYIIKPIKPRALISRLAALTKRERKTKKNV